VLVREDPEPRPGGPFRSQNQAHAGKDGRRWLQPPFFGISGEGETISGGFNRRLTPILLYPVKRP